MMTHEGKTAGNWIEVYAQTKAFGLSFQDCIFSRVERKRWERGVIKW